MTFLAPMQLLWLGLLVPLVALYILKRRRQRRVIGSTLLWEQALRDMRAERPWKKLIPQVSLLLQILAIVVGAIALARPAGAGSVPSGAWVAVVVDTSASMAARQGNSTRFTHARDAALDIARSLPPGGRMMLVEANAEGDVLAPLTSDRASLEQAIGQLQVRGGHANLEGAVAVAAERLRDAPGGSHVLLLTDGSEDGEMALDQSGAPVEVRLVRDEAPDGTPAPFVNTAIIDADVRQRTGEGPDRCDVFVRVHHHGAEARDVFVSASIDGREGVVASRRVTIEPGATESIVMGADLPPSPDGRAAVVRVSIAPGDGGALDDDLSLDDLAVVPSPGSRRLPVFLVGTAPRSVQRVLRSDADVELFATSLTALAERDADEPPLDGLFLYTGDTPVVPPAGDSVVLAPVDDQAFELSVGAEVEAPRIVTWDESDARLRFVGFSDVHIGTMRPLEGGAGRVLVDTDAGAAVVSVSRPNGESTILAFDPDRTDWSSHTSFVVFFRNLLERARARRSAGGVPVAPLGEPLRVPALDGEEVQVTTPSGRTLVARSRGGVAIVEVGADPGVYAIRTGDRELHALRSLLDERESDLSARARFTRGGNDTRSALSAPREHRESWPWVAGVLLLLVLLEAWWATRAPKRIDPSKTPGPTKISKRGDSDAKAAPTAMGSGGASA